MSVISVNAENFKDEVLKSERPVMLDFYATWCGPCQMVSPIVDEIASEYPRYKVCKVDVDNEPQLAQQFGIVSIPTILVINNGNVTAKQVGYATKEKLLQMFE